MLIFAIDDEPNMLQLLHKAIAQAEPGAEILDFDGAAELLDALRSEGRRPDVVFADIEMPDMDGLTLAVEIKNIAPDSKIVFVTGYSEYAMEAYRRHVNGYLLKPALAEKIREELDTLGLPRVLSGSQEKLQVKCFGHFEVFWQGKPLSFSRRKTKELLAFLVDREGGWCSSEEIIDALWEDEAGGKDPRHYLRVLTSELATVLKDIGQGAALLKKRGQWAIAPALLDCDFYRMLAGDMEAVNAFRGEYMVDFSWAELTAGRLHFQDRK